MKTISTLTKRIAGLFFLSLVFAASVNAQSYRVFDPGAQAPAGGTPGAQANFNTGVPTAVGLKFRITQAGTIDAIHFYEGDNNDGPHTVNLFNIDGTNMATAVLPADGLSGWRDVAITPTTVIAGVTYIVSVQSASGFVARSGSTWPASDYTSAPGFIVIGTGPSAADPANPGNGVSMLSASSTDMPTSVADVGANYWVDATFTPFNPLPVTLADFKASPASSTVALTWKTHFESNNRGFEIQRSNNNEDWYEVGFVNGAGQSTSTLSYSFTDKNLAPGLYYYRLKQRDYDGKSKESSTATATISGKGIVSLYPSTPNPFIGTGKIRFDLPNAQQIRLSVFDIHGREVRVLVVGKRQGGTHLVTMNADGLNRQVYIIKLQTENGTFTEKIAIQ